MPKKPETRSELSVLMKALNGKAKLDTFFMPT
jgi:hypothetical protein